MPQKGDTEVKIAAYCRVSTDKEDQLDSLSHQKEFFIEYAQRNGHELFRLYADEGISGTSLKRRDAFNRLMRDARYGMFQAVVVKDISRLARNTVDFLVSIRELKSMGINTIFLTANMDSMGDSEFILTLFSAMAQEESSNLSKRVKFGKRINAEKGRVPQRLFGYDRVDNFTLAINLEEARIVRKIFFLYTEQGLGCRTISQTLNRNGHKTKYGNDWNSRGVRRVLVNPIYQGILINHKYEIQDFLTGKQVSIPKEQHFCHQRPEWAIVTPEVFQKAQEIMESRRIKYESGTPFREARYSSKHIFSTLIKCEHCGRSFTRKTYTYVNTRAYWHCVTNDQYTAERCENCISLNEPDLLRELRQYFSSLIRSRESFVADILSRLEEKLPKTEDPAQTCREVENKRKKLLARKERYREMYANDLLSLSELKAKLSPIMDELKTLDTDPEQIEQSAAIQNHAEQIIQHCAEEIHRFLDLDTITNADMRRVIDHISVNKEGNVRIVLKKFEDTENA